MSQQPPESDFRRMFDIRKNELDSNGNRVLEVELTAVRTHPDDVKRVLRAKGPFELHFEAVRGEARKVGSIDPADPVFRMVFEKGVDADGVWEVTIEGSACDGSWHRELWRQRIVVQKQLRRSHEEIERLAHRYSPVFVFSGTEQYFPVSLRTLLSATEILECNDVMKMKTIFGKESIPLRSLGDFMRFNGHCEYLLDFNMLTMRRSIFAAVGGDPRNATIYYSYFEDPDSDRFFINYHLIYAFDTKAGLAKLTGIGPHVFDRESMVLVFEGDEPQSMIISGHLENQTIFLLEKLKIWSQGRIRVRYDDPNTLKIDTHPVVAVADGSHALYPTSGIYHLSLLREIAGYLHPEVMEEAKPKKGGGEPLRPEQILTPPSLRSEALPGYALRSFGVDQLTSRIRSDAEGFDGHHAYLCFSGFWVDVPGTQNARFPPFTSKEAEIVDWVDGAYAWHWEDLPDKYRRNNELILRFLHENLEDF